MFDKFPEGVYAPSALTNDGRWIMHQEGFLYTYSFMTSSWGMLMDSIPNTSTGNTTAAMDPETGLIYFPNLFDGSMMSLNAINKTYATVPMPSALIPSRQFSVAWSTALRKMFFIGGTTGVSGLSNSLNMYSYNIKDGWIDELKKTKGQVPPARTGACLVSVKTS